MIFPRTTSSQHSELNGILSLTTLNVRHRGPGLRKMRSLILSRKAKTLQLKLWDEVNHGTEKSKDGGRPGAT